MNLTNLLSQLNAANTMAELEIAYEASLGKKWRLASQYATLKDLSPEEKKSIGSDLATAKQQLSDVYENKLTIFKNEKINEQLENDIVDITTPPQHTHQWSYSLLTATRRRIEEICQGMWFIVEYGHDMVYRSIYHLLIQLQRCMIHSSLLIEMIQEKTMYWGPIQQRLIMILLNTMVCLVKSWYHPKSIDMKPPTLLMIRHSINSKVFISIEEWA